MPKHTAWSQRTGFVDVEVDVNFWDACEVADHQVDLRKAGFANVTTIGEHDELAPLVEVHVYASDLGKPQPVMEGKLPVANVVTIDDYCEVMLICLESEAEYVAYRHAFAQSHHTYALGQNVRSLERVAERAFTAWHGHDSRRDCSYCRSAAEERELRQMQRDEARRRDEAKAKAAASQDGERKVDGSQH